MSGVIGTLIGIIVTLVILGVVYWAITQLLPLIPLPEPFARIIHVLLIVILVLIVLWVILVLIGAAGVHVGGPFRWGSLASRAVAAVSTGAAIDL
ncbi:uncharacterized BrkB/YihY/UPF0761 family membrane protein [Bradyrhizobium sp. S3.9.2]|uniref:hypothetical protein n=1 Tax=Bradyrhizobium sp. S3.9.2 TaxID=3156432 RepID=UPI0033949A34